MRRYLSYASAFLAVMLGACAHNGGPLVFVTTHSVGIDIQAVSSNSGTPGLTVGYKSVNLAVVPTQHSTDGGEALRGCYAVGQNGANPPQPCSLSAVTNATVHPTAGRAKQSKYGGDNLGIPNSRGELVPAVLAAPPPDNFVPGGSESGQGGRATPSGQNGGPFAETIVDAYSVYASFDTGAKGNSGPSVNIGEVFATGGAAVQLAEGVNYYESRLGNAAIVSAHSGNTRSLVPTLDKISPDSGTAPAAGAISPTKVPVTLSGTGFSKTSKLNIVGTSALTAGSLTVSEDGKTINTEMIIAPGAAQGSAQISVTNSSPGGGASNAVTFTVN